MKIGSIFDSERQLKTRYSYKKRGMDELFLPDMVCEPSDCGYYTNEFGNLFFGKEVAWYGANLLDGGIDIHIDMFGRCYADHADFAFGHDTGTIRGCLGKSGFHDKLVVGIGNVTELLNVAS